MLAGIAFFAASALGVPIDGDGDGFSGQFDCDDTNPYVYPGAIEVCDGRDNDCDADVDDQDADVSAPIWHADCDADMQGDPTTVYVACTPVVALPCGGTWVLDASDCDDLDALVYVGAAEHCGGGDDNCDGSANAGAVDASTWYIDDDGDQYGTEAVTFCALAPPAGFAATGGDCNDADETLYPGAPDSCGDGVDADCDGADGSASSGASWWPDADGDGWGDASALPTVSCTEDLSAQGYVNDASDCDDTDEDVSPSGDESCNGVDDDCDGTIDDVGPENTWFADEDGDGYGNDEVVVDASCTPPGSWTLDGGDCDDTDAEVRPGAAERCNRVDDDCDGKVDSDDDVTDGVELWPDADGDGYGWCEEPGCNGVRVCAFDRRADQADNGLDCDDTDPSVNPDREEIPGDDVDEDCDGTAAPADAVEEPSGCGCGTSGAGSSGFAVLAALGAALTARGARSPRRSA